MCEKQLDPNQTKFCSQWGSSTSTRRHSSPDPPGNSHSCAIYTFYTSTPHLNRTHLSHLLFLNIRFRHLSLSLLSVHSLLINLAICNWRFLRDGIASLEMMGQERTGHVLLLHHILPSFSPIHPMSVSLFEDFNLINCHTH